MVNSGFKPWYYYIGGMVNAASGNLYHVPSTDITIGIRGFDKKMPIIRSYNSARANFVTDFGRGWIFNYGIYIEEIGAIAKVNQPDGSVDEFTSTGGGNYSPPSGNHSKLVKYQDHFKLFHVNGSYHYFNLSGKLIRVVDKNDNQINLSYTNGKITQISDDSGHYLTFTYSGSLISVITDQLNRQIHYYYDGNNNLIRMNDSMNIDTQYSYINNRLQAIINGENKITGIIYDGSNRSQKLTVGIYNNETINTTYLNSLSTLYYITFNGNSVNYLDANNHLTELTLDVNGRPTQITDAYSHSENITWDSSMNMTVYEDKNGHTTQFSYDSYGNLTQKTDPYNKSDILTWITPSSSPPPSKYICLLSTYTDKKNYTTEYLYDSNSNIETITNPESDSQSFIYDQYGNPTSSTDFNGKTTSYSYQSGRDLIQITDPLTHTVLYEYDSIGRVTSITDQNGHETTYSYNGNDKVTLITDPLSHETSYTYDDIGNILTSTDKNQHTTSFEYDYKVNHISKITSPANKEKNYTYDLLGNMLTETNELNKTTIYQYDNINRLTRITDPLNHYEEYTYDYLNNVLTSRNKNGYINTNTYDNLNRLTRKTDPLNHYEEYSYDDVDNIISITDKNNHVTSYLFDTLRRITRITDALNHYEEYAYDEVGNVLTHTDKNGHATSYAYDDNKRLISVIDPEQNVSTYEYDNVGNIITLTDSNDNDTTYTYDEMNRLLTIETALAKTTTYEYDPVGNLTNITDPIGNETIISYSSTNKIIQKEFKNNQGQTQKVITFTYNDVGKMMTADGGSFGVVTNTYDDVNRLASSSLNYGSFSKITSYGYDNAGNVTSMTNPDNQTTTYTYDDVGRLSTLVDPGAGTFQFLYDNNGNRTRITYPGGGRLDYQYDNVDRLLSIQATGLSVDNISYTYDYERNRSSMTIGNTATNYTYNNKNELLTEIRTGYSSEYTYDGVGNRLTSVINLNSLEYTYDNDNKLTSINDGTVFIYDDNGNMIEKRLGGTTYYYYDIENHLIRTVLPNNDEYQYLICPLGIRIKKITPSTTEYYGYDRGNRLMKYNSVGTTIGRYINNPLVLDEVLAFNNSSWIFNTLDALNTVRYEVDNNGNRISQKIYDGYGVSLNGTIPREFGFTGQVFDFESLLYNYENRMYNPYIGRFNSRDPSGLIRGNDLLTLPNLYSYCNNNPVNCVDPSGCFAIPASPFDKWWHKNIDKPLKRIFNKTKEAAKDLSGQVVDITYYGNWCGSSNKKDKNGNDLEPIDALDTCCKNHDKCYNIMNSVPDFIYILLPAPAFSLNNIVKTACDIVFCACMANIDPNTLDARGRMYRVGAMAIFCPGSPIPAISVLIHIFTTNSWK